MAQLSPSLFSYCFIPFNCLDLFKMFNSVRKCSTHAVMNKFWACQLNMFRMIQNGKKWIKWFKKAQKEFTVFKKIFKKSWLCFTLRTYAQILCLFICVIFYVTGSIFLLFVISYKSFLCVICCMQYGPLYLLNIILLFVSKGNQFKKSTNHHYCSLLCDKSNICDRYDLNAK